MNEAAIRDRLRDHWQFEGVDYDKSHEIYHDDAVLEFPQSGERFVGKKNFLTWRRQYPAKLDFKIRRISHDGDLWVAENLISYDGSPYMFTVNILQFRGDKVAHERLYVFEGFEAAASRAEWAEAFDPLESKSPQEWRDSYEDEARRGSRTRGRGPARDAGRPRERREDLQGRAIGPQAPRRSEAQ